MTKKQPTIIHRDPWEDLKRFTDARISLGRCGASLPLAEALAFKLAHARARDAVWQPFQAARLAEGVRQAGYTALQLASVVADRNEYLTRPDKGRKLDEASCAILADQPRGADICLVVSDGLSSRAVHENALPFIEGFTRLVGETSLTLAPVCIVAGGRVAIADEVASLLGSRLVAILIGERPGLSSPDSMGIYMTYAPKPGVTDEARNCISNVRKAGQSVADAARKLAYLVEEAFRMQRSGVALKDRMTSSYLPFAKTPPAVKS